MNAIDKDNGQGKTGENESLALNSQVNDYLASVLKSALGLVPFAGSLLAEVAGTIIPNQRIDRIANFAKELEEKFSNLNQEFVKSQLTNENFTDLMEEGIRQAARSLSDERREYIAAIIKNGLSSEDIKFFESKHLLRILGEINDVEVIILRYYLIPTMGGDGEFREKHGDIVWPEPTTMSAPQRVFDKDTLHGSYKEHLATLGLLEREYEREMRTHEPIFNTQTGGLKIRDYQITSLGRMLLRHIDLRVEGWN